MKAFSCANLFAHFLKVIKSKVNNYKVNKQENLRTINLL